MSDVNLVKMAGGNSKRKTSPSKSTTSKETLTQLFTKFIEILILLVGSAFHVVINIFSCAHLTLQQIMMLEGFIFASLFTMTMADPLKTKTFFEFYKTSLCKTSSDNEIMLTWTTFAYNIGIMNIFCFFIMASLTQDDLKAFKKLITG